MHLRQTMQRRSWLTLEALVEGKASGQWTRSTGILEPLTLPVHLPKGEHEIRLRVTNWMNAPLEGKSNVSV
jgi:hypothetical protein